MVNFYDFYLVLNFKFRATSSNITPYIERYFNSGNVI